MSYEWRERWRKQHRRRIRSKEWRELKQRLLRERGARCQRCGDDDPPSLVLHHNTYERLGHERDDDLELVCGKCHPSADLQRSLNNRARALQRRWRGVPQPSLFKDR